MIVSKKHHVVSGVNQTGFLVQVGSSGGRYTVIFLKRWCMACFFGIKCLSNKRVFSMVIPCLHWIRISLHHPLWITVMWVTHTFTQSHSALTFLLYFQEHSSAGTLIVVVWSSSEELARVLSVHSSPGKSLLHYINLIFF